MRTEIVLSILPCIQKYIYLKSMKIDMWVLKFKNQDPTYALTKLAIELT